MAKSHTPRCILIRHGQTAWSKSGQYTSVTDLALTPYGEKQMKMTGQLLIGDAEDTLINPKSIKLIISSPRKRAIQTKDLILGKYKDDFTADKGNFEINEDIREWEYGDYEGLLTKEIIDLRKERGLGDDWNIWEFGCESGEDSEQVKTRIDNLIGKIQKIHQQYLDADKDCDILIIAHGHILRCFAARWIKLEINKNPRFMLDAGGVCVLSYQHHNIEEPALFLTGAFTVPVEEEGDDI